MLRPLPPNFRFSVCGISDVCSFEKDGVTDVFSFDQPADRDPIPVYTFEARIKRYIVHDSHSVYHRESGLSIPDETLVKSIIEHCEEVISKIKSGERVYVLFQCHAGISRSTAAAFIFLSILLGNGREFDAFEYVKAYRREAHPNPLIIAIAQKLLLKNDRMTEALRKSGRRYKTDITF